MHSELGNGKTVFIQSLETLLIQKGYQVYHFRKYRSTISRELEHICKNHNQTVIVFEDYVGSLDTLKSLSILYTDQILIVSERTATNEANYHLLNDYFGDFYHVNINLLDNKEVECIVNLFDHYGLWHEMAAKLDKQKIDFIQRKCNLKIGNVILKLLESPNILNKYQAIIDKIKKKNVYYDAILFILIAHISKLNLDLDDVSNALGTTNLNTPSFKRDPIVNEFIDFDKDQIKQKSSIVSEFILRDVL